MPAILCFVQGTDVKITWESRALTEYDRRGFDAVPEAKPTEAVSVGMFPRFSDQPGENVRFVRETAARS